jgi:holliday junction DNA helicase RuvB
MMAHSYKKSIEPEAADLLVSISRKVPRFISNYFDLFGKNLKAITLSDISDYMVVMDIDNEGLETIDRRYLEALLNQKKPMGIKTIATLINEEPILIEDKIEPFLMEKGLVEKLSNGRKITPKGKAYITGEDEGVDTEDIVNSLLS